MPARESKREAKAAAAAATPAAPAKPALPAKPKAAAAAAKPTRPPKAPKPVDPHRLVKRDDGYASADGRFEVSGTQGSFYLADSARLNPFGLPTIDGPYRTLTELRAAVAAAVDDGGTRG
jgi:hypothetical protein